ncbi:hypothetical protein [Candidatus Protochlamydia sp. W-9]|uniref:hypothetical protein n=1 Tax=Candidatus Protochlamydia sp. W-9 TaxID=1785087 RepID=UPI00096A88D7|nr:hypothetical protein [Candidatus Protochlamydia sp. W-9]
MANVQLSNIIIGINRGNVLACDPVGNFQVFGHGVTPPADYQNDCEIVKAKVIQFINNNKDAFQPNLVDAFEQQLKKTRSILSRPSSFPRFLEFFLRFIKKPPLNRQFEDKQFLETLFNSINLTRNSRSYPLSQSLSEAANSCSTNYSPSNAFSVPEAEHNAFDTNPAIISSDPSTVALTEHVATKHEIPQNGQINQIVSINPPPPPLPPPPPPTQRKPLGATSQTKTTSFLENSQVRSEADYYTLESKKLKRKLKERANPSGFYSYKINPEEAKLATAINEKIKTILDRLEKSEPTTLQDANIQELIQSMKNDLQKNEIIIKGSSTAIAGIHVNGNNGVRTFLPEFISVANKLTNQEIQFVIGQYFNGIAPTQTHPDYAIYKLFQCDLDIIFSQWDTLSTGEIAQEFSLFKDTWNDYLKKQLKSLLGLLINRQNPNLYQVSNNQKEPIYQRVSYEDYLTKPKQKVVQQELNEQPTDVLSELTNSKRFQSKKTSSRV